MGGVSKVFFAIFHLPQKLNKVVLLYILVLNSKSDLMSVKTSEVSKISKKKKLRNSFSAFVFCFFLRKNVLVF